MKNLILVLAMVVGFNSVAKADGMDGIIDILSVTSDGSVITTGGVATTVCAVGSPVCIPAIVVGAVALGGDIALRVDTRRGVFQPYGFARNSLQDNSPLVEQAYAGHGELVETVAKELNVSVEQASKIILDTKADFDSKK